MTSEALPALPRIRAMGKFFFEGDQKFFLKGVTYGPFKPDAEGHYLGSPQQLERDLAQMREIGLNVVRIYHVPPRWFLDQCAAAGVRVLITLPWAKHVEFLTKRKARHEIIRSVRSAVEANRWSSRDLCLPRWQRNFCGDGALVRRAARDGIC